MSIDNQQNRKLVYSVLIIQRASEASEADYQSCSIEISDIYIYINWRASVASETLTGVKMKKSGMFIGERAKRARHSQG